MKITAEKLKVLCPNASLERLNLIAVCLNFNAVDFPGLYKIEVLEEFIPQLVHESGGFRIKEESGNYKAERILQVFPKYFKTLDQAKPYANNPVKLFNKVYARRMGNGDEMSGDGYRFRGGGFIQITGRETYTKYARFVGRPVEKVVEMIRTDDYFAMHSACWLFAIEKKLIPDALNNHFDRVTYAINGGYNGKSERDKLYTLTKQVLRA